MIYNNDNTYSFPNSNGTISGDAWNSSIKFYTEVYILGDYIKNISLSDIEVNMISTLNVLGEPYWKELKRLDYAFSEDVEEFIEKRIKIERRNKNIDIITNS